MNEIIYFELNNWFPDRDYPNAEPFTSWLDFNWGGCVLQNEDWCKENQLCVIWTHVDMSSNYCVTAQKDWVEQVCPELLTKYTKFLRYPNPKYDNEVYGQFGHSFLEWSPEHFGSMFVEDDEY